ncbi:uncharacterized protein LOC125449621 isoform X2 [Stegostoma tigrinum]|uniref:uncharacterized protein LOC125449621 isoform X2 n=1 Tax=Stegostoma tigrinum TaxID=3053191 RepID=UPI00202B7F27|nr:uncharacterized protein LOC125449621 isoform X2 [Stegostoma tigrinum]
MMQQNKKPYRLQIGRRGGNKPRKFLKGSAQVMKKICQILEELTEEELKQFKQLLADHEVPAGKLEKAAAWAVVDQLRKHFKDSTEALDVVLQILQTIPRMDLVLLLTAEKDDDEHDGNRKQSADLCGNEEQAISEKNRARGDDAEFALPIYRGNAKVNVPTSSGSKSKNYGRNGKLRNPSISQIFLGLMIGILGTASAIITPHRPFLQARVPWWCGVLFCVIGIIPLLPLKISEKCKLCTVLISNIAGFLIALTSIGLSIWNGVDQHAENKTCISSYHWIILCFAVLQMLLSGWNIGVVSFWLNQDCEN